MGFKKFVCKKCGNTLEIEESIVEKYDGWTCPNCGEVNDIRKDGEGEKEVS